MRRVACVMVVIAACGGSPPTTIVATPTPAPVTDAAIVAVAPDAAIVATPPPPPCVAPGKLTGQRGAYAIEHDEYTARVVRLDGNCAIVIGTLDIRGPFAFGELLEHASPDGIPDVSIDTWLMHGDRLRRDFHWSGSSFTQTGSDEDVPGPGKYRPH